MTFAQFHYPFENKEFFEKNFPAQFVAEYIGQVRAWFYYMNVLSAILFDDIPFENVVTTGTVLAEDGQKMSKSKNNFPDPMILINKYGTDALRFYLMGSQVMNAENFNFSEKGVDETYKKVILMLYNVANFYELYANIKEKKTLDSENLLDKWIISRTNQLIKEIDAFYRSYDTIGACTKIKTFIEDLSTWYVRRNRDRFNDGDKDAKTTLKYVLENLSKSIAPILPFSAEMLYKTLGNKNSVHLENWPDHSKKLMDENLEIEMLRTREVVSIALRERDVQKLPLKQPLSEIKIQGYDIPKKYEEIILDELNVKKVNLVKSEEKKIELNTKITPELEAEGIAREIARFIQNERKNAGLIKEDRIALHIAVEGLDFLKMIARPEAKFIPEKVGATKISKGELLTDIEEEKHQYSAESQIKGKKIKIYFNKIG